MIATDIDFVLSAQNDSVQDKVHTPFLPPYTGHLRYTLVLDLDETLIHYNETTRTVAIRPGAESFLRLISNCYEIIIFTAATEDYANWALSCL